MKTYKFSVSFEVKDEDGSIGENGIEKCIEDLKFDLNSPIVKKLSVSVTEVTPVITMPIPWSD